MTRISLPHGRLAVVSDQDAEYVSRFRWHDNGSGYACRKKRSRGRQFRVYLHRLIVTRMGRSLRRGVVDHINGDRLDNRRCNLRVVSHSENLENGHKIRKDCKTGYKGVKFEAGRRCPWRAYISVDGKRKMLGSFTSPEAAALAYNQAAITLREPSGYLNRITLDRTDVRYSSLLHNGLEDRGPNGSLILDDLIT